MDNIYNYPYFNIESALERVTTQALSLQLFMSGGVMAAFASSDDMCAHLSALRQINP